MKYHHRCAATVLFVIVLGVSSVTNAALVSRLGGLAVYDTDLNITWAADAYMASWSQWADANTWATNLVIGGVSGWRLPSTLQPDATCSIQSGGVSYGYNCTGSEMGHLFNALGGVAGSSLSTTHNVYYDLFSNIQEDFGYWSGTEYAPDTNYAWYFVFFDGYQQGNVWKGSGEHVWAVHSGDVGASVVPVPAAVWLFGSGLLGLVGVTRRKAA